MRIVKTCEKQKPQEMTSQSDNVRQLSNKNNFRLVKIKQISQWDEGHVPHPTFFPGKCASGIFFFASPVRNGLLPAKLKFKEDTGFPPLSLMCGCNMLFAPSVCGFCYIYVAFLTKIAAFLGQRKEFIKSKACTQANLFLPASIFPKSCKGEPAQRLRWIGATLVWGKEKEGFSPVVKCSAGKRERSTLIKIMPGRSNYSLPFEEGFWDLAYS